MQENLFEYIILIGAPFCLALKALQPKHDSHFKFYLKLEMKLKMLSSK